LAGNIRAFVAELLGTFAWVTLVAGTVSVSAMGDVGIVGIAMAQGLAVAAVFALFGKFAPGLFNPAFTLALAASRQLDWVKAALALVCQLLGAALAGLFLAQTFSHSPVVNEPPYLGTPIAAHLGYRAATLVEAVLTFFLMLAACRTWQTMSGNERVNSALIVGAVAAASVLFGGPLTGAALNPARAFGPAVASGFWSQHYIYWFGPTAGAMLAVTLSRFLFDK
jgi:aquaporin Z